MSSVARLALVRGRLGALLAGKWSGVNSSGGAVRGAVVVITASRVLESQMVSEQEASSTTMKCVVDFFSWVYRTCEEVVVANKVWSWTE